MEFSEWLPQAYDKGYAIWAALGVIGVAVVKALSTFGQALDLHDKYFVRRRLERLESLRSNTLPNTPLAAHLDEVIELEKFRISSGIATSTEKKDWLIRLDCAGIWKKADLKAVSRYLYTDIETLETNLSISKSDLFGAVISFLGGLCLLLAGTAYFLAFYIKLGTVGFFIGAGVFGCFVFVGRLISSDGINYRIARKVERFLAQHGLPANRQPR